MKEITMQFRQLMIISLFVLFLFTGDFLDAAIYYVSTNGNDITGNGTFEQPWLTIEKGWKNLTPGDTLLVRGGRYHESLTLTKQGTKDNPITIKAYRDEKPVLSGGVVIKDWKPCKSLEDALGNPNWKNIYKATIPKANPVILENKKYAFLCSDIKHKISAYQCVDYFTKISQANDGQNRYLIDNNRLEHDGFWNGCKIQVHLYNYNNNTQERTISSFKTDINGNKIFIFDTPMPVNLRSDESR
nr:hypothetical protein [Anaerohalosphaeraceae bacterium]